MKVKAKPHHGKREALQALKVAVVEGAVWRYDHLVDLALKAGASDEEIDLIAHEALQALLTGAELPLTPGELAHGW